MFIITFVKSNSVVDVIVVTYVPAKFVIPPKSATGTVTVPEVCETANTTVPFLVIETSYNVALFTGSIVHEKV